MKEISFGGCVECEPIDNDADFRLAYILYQAWGQSKVYDAVIEGIIRHDEWKDCEPCQTDSPFLDDTCLVCGSSE